MQSLEQVEPTLPMLASLHICTAVNLVSAQLDRRITDEVPVQINYYPDLHILDLRASGLDDPSITTLVEALDNSRQQGFATVTELNISYNPEVPLFGCPLQQLTRMYTRSQTMV